jgi:hypothetical protein
VSDNASTEPLSVSCAIVSLAQYEWRLLHDEIVQRGAAFRERGAALRSLTNRAAVDQDLFEVRTLSASRNECYAL